MKLIGSLPGGTTDPQPEITCYLPEGDSKGIGLIILPGGGYGVLAEHEGKGYAEHFAAAGIACFVVTYRLGSQGFKHPAMLEDALAAVHTVRSRANDFGIDPNKIGIMGSSAGGHLAAHAMTANGEYATDGSLRPDFGVLCYPVILSTGEFCHQGSMQNLAGKDASQDLLDSLSCDKRVGSNAPPCFLWHTTEDIAVPPENSMAYASALRKHGIRFELHLYEKGRHGVGLGADFDWAGDCLRWIDGLF